MENGEVGLLSCLKKRSKNKDPISMRLRQPDHKIQGRE